MAISASSKILASDISAALDTKLALSGGSATTESFLNRDIDTSRLMFFGGTDYNSGCLILYGKNHADYPGEARLRAGNSNNLRVLSDGQCLVGNNHIVRSVNGATADTDGVATPIVCTTGTYSLTLPSGGSWIVINIVGDTHYLTNGTLDRIRVGTTPDTNVSNSEVVNNSYVYTNPRKYSGGTRVLAVKSLNSNAWTFSGSLLAIRVAS